MTRAGLDKSPRDVAAMFDRVARRYDLTNDLLSLGQARLWRYAVARAVSARPGQHVLDLAAGTGTSGERIAATGARVLACDFSLGMLTEGARRRGGASVGGITLLAGDALALPFRDAVFDAVTISFGLRNVSDLRAALVEMRRVTKPGGRLVVCEFSVPPSRPFRTAYTEYLMRALPPVARAVSSNPEAYVYLAESIRAWPDQRALAGRIAAAGWGSVGWRNHSGGIVAVHSARRPGGPVPAPQVGRRRRRDRA